MAADTSTGGAARASVEAVGISSVALDAQPQPRPAEQRATDSRVAHGDPRNTHAIHKCFCASLFLQSRHGTRDVRVLGVTRASPRGVLHGRLRSDTIEMFLAPPPIPLRPTGDGQRPLRSASHLSAGERAMVCCARGDVSPWRKGKCFCATPTLPRIAFARPASSAAAAGCCRAVADAPPAVDLACRRADRRRIATATQLRRRRSGSVRAAAVRMLCSAGGAVTTSAGAMVADRRGGRARHRRGRVPSSRSSGGSATSTTGSALTQGFPAPGPAPAPRTKGTASPRRRPRRRAARAAAPPHHRPVVPRRRAVAAAALPRHRGAMPATPPQRRRAATRRAPRQSLGAD